MKIDFCKKDFVWVGLFIILISVGFSIALNSGNYQVMGHSSDEMAPPVGCLANEALIWDGVAWVCGTPAGGIATVILGAFGDWETKASGTTYTADTDGVIVAHTTRPSNPGVAQMTLWIESPVGSVRVRERNNNQGNNQYLGVTSPVKAGDTWRVDVVGYQAGVGQDFVYWMPIESSGAGVTLENCAWTGWGTCGAASGGSVLCSSNQVMNAIDIVGCSEGGCADITRCQKTRIKCCGFS